MASTNDYRQYIGTEDAPIALSGDGSIVGNGSIWTFTHNNGRKAVEVAVLDAVSRQVIGPSDSAAPTLKAVICTQPTANQIVVTNQSTAAVNIILRVTWSDLSASVGAPLSAGAGVYTPPPG